MPDLGKADLLGRIQTALELSGWRMFIQNDEHPFRIVAGKQGDTRNLIVYIWNLTSGGPASVRPADEYRIQITGVTSPLLTDPNSTTLLLGWYEDLQVFAAFDIRRHINPGSSASIQVRLPTIEQAVERGFAFQRRGNGELVIVVAPDQLMDYLLHQVPLHRFGQKPEEAQLLTDATLVEPPTEEIAELPRERREAIHTVRSLVRARSFRRKVLSAYDHSCAVCHTQLMLVQAAHIVPVHVPGSSDETTNGLALCPSHHTAYDDGLLTVAPNYHVMVSEARLQRLRSENLHGGEDLLLQYVCNTILLPNSISEQPLPANLEHGMKVRGWL